MKAVITVIGQDRVGIIAGVSTILSDAGVNILDISQTIMQELFTMIMLVDLSSSQLKNSSLIKKLDDLSAQLGVSIKFQDQEIFNSMHRI